MQRFSTRVRPEEFKEWNERMVEKYDPDAFHHHSNHLVRLIERERVRIILKLIDLRKEDDVLEIGCGAGNVIEKASNGKLFGVDISFFILTKAKQKLRKMVYLFQGDAQNLPCNDQVFTKVICSEVFEHLIDPEAAISEMSRVLKVNGVAVISIPNELLINRIKKILIQLRIFRWLTNQRGGYGDMPERMDDEWHLHALPLKEWLNVFNKFFRVTRLRRIPFFCLPLRYVARLEKVG